MEKKKYASNTRAKNKWNAANYDRLYPYVKKGKKATYLAAAKAATDAKRRYYEKTYDRLYPAVKKGKKELYIAAAQAAGKSLNEWIETTLDAAAQQTNGE